MEISVSRLNNRMALQLPAELPLGLVFISGTVTGLRPAKGKRSTHLRFYLVEAEHRLFCLLPQQVAKETMLQEGNRVRVSGHLVFDPHTARYCLLSRDLEVLPRQQAPQIVARTDGAMGMQKRTGALAQPDLPAWVKKLAPPEIQEELGLTSPNVDATAPLPLQLEQHMMGGKDSLTPEMLSFLSSAIDSDQEIELTPEMIGEYLSRTPPAQAIPGKARPTTTPTLAEAVSSSTIGQAGAAEAPVVRPRKKMEAEPAPVATAPRPAPRPTVEGEEEDQERWRAYILPGVTLLLIVVIIVITLLIFVLLGSNML